MLRKTIITVVACIALMMGTVDLSKTQAQMLMYYDPYEYYDESEMEEEEEIENITPDVYLEEYAEWVAWLGVGIWFIGGMILVRYIRIYKNKIRRSRMERMRHHWKIGRIAAIGIVLMSAIPTAKAQVFLDEKTRERAVVPEMRNVIFKDPNKVPGSGSYAPLGGELMVLGMLGGAYLVGKRRKKEE